MTDVRYQATWRLVADGRWEVDVHDGIPAHLPEHLRDRFETDEDSGPKLRCEASEVVSIMAEIVKVAVWWGSRPMTHYRFRANEDREVQFLYGLLEDVGAEVSMWMPIPAAEGDVKVDFYCDLDVDKMRGVLRSSPGGARMLETFEARQVDADEPDAPPAKGEA